MLDNTPPEAAAVKRAVRRIALGLPDHVVTTAGVSLIRVTPRDRSVGRGSRHFGSQQPMPIGDLVRTVAALRDTASPFFRLFLWGGEHERQFLVELLGVRRAVPKAAWR